MLLLTRVIRIVFAIWLATSGIAFAADTGFYIGGSFGQARPNFNSRPAIVGGLPTTYDSSDSVWGAFGGYQINKYFSAELRYVRLGEYNAAVSVPGAGPLFTNIQVTGWGAALVGALPLGKDFSLLGRIGETRLRETRGNCNICTGQTLNSSDNIWSPSFGIGLKYDFNPNLSARGEVERFTKIGSTDNTFGGAAYLYSVGLAYKF